MVRMTYIYVSDHFKSAKKYISVTSHIHILISFHNHIVPVNKRTDHISRVTAFDRYIYVILKVKMPKSKFPVTNQIFSLISF